MALEITPPPWRAYVEANGDYWLVDNWSPNDGNYDGLIVAQFPVGGRYAEGNANLMAEAPDLRTRLQRAEELLQESRSRIAGAINTGQMDQCHDFIQRIDAYFGGHHDD